MCVKLLVIMCFFIQILFCQRKILNPSEPTEDKPYMVYLVMAPQSDSNFTGWLCGGAIVHPYYVLTAASCIHDAQFVYVISGYRNYIPSEDIESDNCTRLLKKKIIHVCSHTRFHMNHRQWHSWSMAEVGFARVDTPFDYRDRNYLKYCSYLPKAIPMSFIHVRPGDDAIALGWGHNRYFRPKYDTQDYNMQTLQYSTVRVVNPAECVDRYRIREEGLIPTFAICAKSADVIDSEGNRPMPTELKYGCFDQNNDTQPNPETPLLAQEHICNENEQYFYDSRKMFTAESYPKEMNSRRGGICQNDHGGPLVMWHGGRETVVGVASMFLVSKQMECIGPFMFMALHCINGFVHCMFPDMVMIGISIRHKRLYDCNKTKSRDYEMIERNLSWDNFENAPPKP